MSAAALVSAIRNRNSRSSVQAPSSNLPSVGGTARFPRWSRAPRPRGVQLRSGMSGPGPRRSWPPILRRPRPGRPQQRRLFRHRTPHRLAELLGGLIGAGQVADGRGVPGAHGAVVVGRITMPAATLPRSTSVSSDAGSATDTTLSCGVRWSWRTSAAPSGPDRAETTPRRGVDEPPNVAPSTRINSIGKTTRRRCSPASGTSGAGWRARSTGLSPLHLCHPPQAGQRDAPGHHGERQHGEGGTQTADRLPPRRSPRPRMNHAGER